MTRDLNSHRRLLTYKVFSIVLFSHIIVLMIACTPPKDINPELDMSIESFDLMLGATAISEIDMMASSCNLLDDCSKFECAEEPRCQSCE